LLLNGMEAMADTPESGRGISSFVQQQMDSEGWRFQ
jgi:hypothetical protein